MKYNEYNVAFQLFLLFVFFLGLYVYGFKKLDTLLHEGMDKNNENNENNDDRENNENNEENNEETCPDMLIDNGDVILLYNSSQPTVEGQNPLSFYNMDDYIKYLDEQKKKNNKRECPILYLQKSYNAQGKLNYLAKSGPFDNDAGYPVTVIDASLLDPPYNQGQYASFDPSSQYVGVYTNLDQLHDATLTNTGQWSDNPMDPNWGGVLFTQMQIDNGKYDENNVIIPSYFTPKSGMALPIGGTNYQENT